MTPKNISKLLKLGKNLKSSLKFKFLKTVRIQILKVR